MPEEIEIEFKNMLNEEEFDRIKVYFSMTKDDFTLQNNHYFDTPSGRLKDHQCALRIREKNGTFELTLKQPAETGLLETNQPVNEQTATQMLEHGILPPGEVSEALHRLGINPDNLSHFGTLSTNRAETEYNDGLMVLDFSSYLNKEDYELEYEVKDRRTGEAIFSEFLESMKIPFRPADNKIKRFLRAANSN
ncbi:CYTH domain-containing protein [Bacillus salacetis]|uniref:CYTH domain-containing protein n=2 Tax=Bacillus salacetis TaxID=2315464 RepID=A0A3A1QN73_9BACI|nr:CYTH domain-containing protein [Bacillus salacetis]